MKQHATLALIGAAAAALITGCASTGYGGPVYVGGNYYDSWGWGGSPWYGVGPATPIGPPPPRPGQVVAPAPRPAAQPMPVQR